MLEFNRYSKEPSYLKYLGAYTSRLLELFHDLVGNRWKTLPEFSCIPPLTTNEPL